MTPLTYGLKGKMDKKEAKKLGAWIMLLGGCCFVVGALTASYIVFALTPQISGRFLLWLGRLHHRF